MFWLVVLSVFCIGLTLFFSLKKRKEKRAPDYSYIIFKDYTSASTGTFPLSGSKAEEGVKQVAKQINIAENISQQQDHPQDDPPCATLNFED